MKKIYLTLSFLIIILVGLSIYWQNITSLKNGITVVENNQETVLSMAKLKDFTHLKVVPMSDEMKTFSGFSIQSIIELSTIDKSKSVIFSSRDGMSVAIQPRDFKSSYLCLIEKDKEKFYQLVVITDPFSQRWVKYINRIEVK